MVKLSRRLHQDAGKLRQGMNRLAGQVGYGLNLLHPLMDGGSLFKFHRLRSGVALAFQPGEHGRAARGEKSKHICRFLPVPLIGAALIARGKAHLHLGVNTAGKGRIGVEVFRAAAQQKQVQHLIRVPLGRCARGKRTKKRVGRSLADFGRHINPGIRVVDRHPQENRRAQAQALFARSPKARSEAW